MRRHLQKHGKIIMAILGVALMIVFAMPAFRNNVDRSGSPAGRLNGEKISNLDIASAAGELQLLNTFNYRVPGLDERERGLHWLLLVRQAARYGFDTLGISSEELMKELTLGSGLHPETLTPAEIDTKVEKTEGASLRALLQSRNHLAAVMGLIRYVSQLPKPNAAIELAADQRLTKIQVAYASIDGTKGWQSNADPTSDQIDHQFQLYKGVVRTPASNDLFSIPPLPPLIDDHHFPFGYKYPDRAAVEYLVFNRDELRSRFKPTDDDELEAYKYFRDHPDEFKNQTSPGVVSSQPAAKRFDDVKASLIARQIDQRVSKLLKRMLDRARTRSEEPWKTVATDGKGLDPNKWASYQDIAADIAKNREFEGYKPQYKATLNTDGKPQLFGPEELAAIPGIGQATYSRPSQDMPFSFAELATHVRELAPDLTARNPLGQLFLQAGADGPTLTDSSGNLYLYRVVATEASHEPKSVAEVRPQVIDDLKKRASYERAAQTARDLAEQASKPGLDLTKIAALQQIPAQKSPDFSRSDEELPLDIRGIRGFTDAAFTLVPQNSTSQPAATRPTGIGMATALNNDGTLKTYAIQLLKVSPATPTDFVMALVRAQNGLQGQDYQDRSYIPILMPYFEQDGNFRSKLLSLEGLMHDENYVPVNPIAPRKDSDT